MWRQQTIGQIRAALALLEENKQPGQYANVAYDKQARCWNAWYSHPNNGWTGVGATAPQAAEHLVEMIITNKDFSW